MSIASLKIMNIHYILIIIGLISILVSNTFDETLLKIDIDESLANLGVLLFLIGGIQWLYDASVRQQLYKEITSLTVKNINVVTSGVVDVLSSSKDVDYTDSIKESSLLTIGLNYTPRILEDYYDEFKERSRIALNTKVIAIDLESKAGDLVLTREDDSEHIKPNLKKLQRIVDEINDVGSGKIEILYHSAVLRYSFVQTDSSIWIKPYRNSDGRFRTPAIQIKSGTGLHEFFSSDIDMLIKQALAP